MSSEDYVVSTDPAFSQVRSDASRLAFNADFVVTEILHAPLGRARLGPVPPDAAVPEGLSLIIPAYNEEDRLGPTLDSYLPALESLSIPFEVLVVMDGTDGTPAVTAQYASRHVHGLQYQQKLGRGGAIFAGFHASRYRMVAYADADASVDSHDLLRLVQLARDGAPVVIASRRVRPELVVIPERSFRRFIGSIWYGLVHSILGVRVKDAHCGLKVLHRRVMERVARELTVTNRTFEVGLLFHAMRDGFPVLEVSVAYKHDFRTRMPVGMAIPIMFLTLIGVRMMNAVQLRHWLPERALIKLNRTFASV